MFLICILSSGHIASKDTRCLDLRKETLINPGFKIHVEAPLCHDSFREEPRLMYSRLLQVRGGSADERFRFPSR